MWPICLACLFAFPQPRRGDLDDIKHEVESFYGPSHALWNEVAGPYAKIQLHLLTPDRGTADVILTWFSLYGTRSEPHRVIVSKQNGRWVIRPAPDL